MNREIKFRAYYIPEKIWFSWADIMREFNHYDKPFETTEDWKVMQYTGLKDLDGKEIYEGDIVTAENIDRPQVVFYSKVRAAYRMGFRGEDTQYDKQEPIWDEDYCEVIGNIWENGDLLND